MRNIAAVVVSLAFAAAAFAQQQPSTFQVHGYVAAREIYVKAGPSWDTGGAGRFDVGADTPDDHKLVNLDVAQLGVDWTPLTWLSLHADGLARHEPSGTEGRRAGLVQAYVDVGTAKLSLRAGAFWLPTSRENVDPLWNSRYTITYSAWNSWVAQEVRPIGVDLQYSPSFYFTVGATAFRGNQTMGTELADHGWTFGNRMTVYNEPLPEPGGDDDYTRPIGHDLGGPTGFAARVRVQMPERAMIQLMHLDNEAKLGPAVDGQTPWRTKFDLIGGSIGATTPTTVAAEWARGSTAVGFTGGSYTMNFQSGYVLLSQKQGANRWTTRYDKFSTASKIHSTPDSGREDGHALTVAVLHDMGTHVRTGLEYVKAKGDRPGVIEAGIDPRTSGSTITVELRYGF